MGERLTRFIFLLMKIVSNSRHRCRFDAFSAAVRFRFPISSYLSFAQRAGQVSPAPVGWLLSIHMVILETICGSASKGNKDPMVVL